MQKERFFLKTTRCRQFVFFGLKVAFGASCVFLLYNAGGIDVQSITGAIVNSPLKVLAGFALVLTMILLGIMRWYLVMRLTGVSFSLANTVAVGLIGIFFATFFPGGVTADVMRSYYSSGDRKFSSEAMLAVIIDRGGAIMGQLLTVVCCGVVVFERVRGSVFEMPFYIITASSGILVLLVASFYLNVFSWVLVRFGKWSECLLHIQQKPLAFIVATLISAINSVLLGVSLSVFARAVVGTMEVGMDFFLFVGPFVAVSLTIPITPAGLGTGQIAGLLLFNNMTNQAIDCGAEIVTLVQLSWIVVGLFGAVVFTLYKKQGELQ